MNMLAEEEKVTKLASVAEEFAENGEIAQAIQTYQELLSLKPNDAARYYYQLGELFYTQRDCLQASDAYHHAIDDDPELSQALLGIGRCAVRLKVYPEAEKAYKQALQQEPELSSEVGGLFMELAQSLVEDKQYPIAYKAYENALGLNPEIKNQVISALQALLNLVQQENDSDLAEQIQQRIAQISQQANFISSPSSAYRKTHADEVEAIDESDAIEQIDENELLLLQLHQTQEELESLFLRNNELEEQLKAASTDSTENDTQAKFTEEAQEELKKITAERDEQARLAAEAQEELKKITAERDEQAKLAIERQRNLEQYITQSKQLEEENSTLAQRQQLLDEEFIKAEAQIELIKDILIKEKAF